MKIVGSLISILFASNLMAAGVDVRFAGACADGEFDAQGADIEYFNLDMDLLEGFGGESKECVMTTTIPARRGFAIDVSEFKAEGFADIEDSGIATMFVNHRFNGQTVRGVRDVARASGDLIVFQRAIGKSVCSHEVVLRTKLTTKANNALVFQDSANSNTVRYKFKYVRCR